MKDELLDELREAEKKMMMTKTELNRNLKKFEADLREIYKKHGWDFEAAKKEFIEKKSYKKSSR